MKKRVIKIKNMKTYKITKFLSIEFGYWNKKYGIYLFIIPTVEFIKNYSLTIFEFSFLNFYFSIIIE